MAISNILSRLAATFVPFALTLAATSACAEEAAKDYSSAERALFMTDQFAKLQPPLTLHYRFRRSGSIEPGFEDKASIELKAKSGGRCCDATGDFLSGEHKVELPPVEGATGNPVTLFFLERDVREMQRLTTGRSNYFRKRIRIALFKDAQQRAVMLNYRGKTVAAQEFTISPYVDDPNRARFEQLAAKQYVFTLSEGVPGGVYAIRTQVIDGTKGANAPPLLAEELLIDGADTSGKPGS